jgi:hypothetical protein
MRKVTARKSTMLPGEIRKYMRPAQALLVRLRVSSSGTRFKGEWKDRRSGWIISDSTLMSIPIHSYYIGRDVMQKNLRKPHIGNTRISIEKQSRLLFDACPALPVSSRRLGGNLLGRPSLRWDVVSDWGSSAPA